MAAPYPHRFIWSDGLPIALEPNGPKVDVIPDVESTPVTEQRNGYVPRLD